MDFTSISNAGVLEEARFRAGSVVYSCNSKSCSEIGKSGSKLHKIASEVFASFSGIYPEKIGLGGESSTGQLELLHESDIPPPLKPKPPRGGWAAYERVRMEQEASKKKWWKFW